MIFVDTGYFIARANPRDALHERAVRWEAAITGRLLVTEYVLSEVVNFFSSVTDRSRGHAIVSIAEDANVFEKVNAERIWFEKGLQLHRSRLDKDWSLTDCISFEVMRQYGVTQALAYDHHFEQAGFEALLRREP